MWGVILLVYMIGEWDFVIELYLFWDSKVEMVWEKVSCILFLKDGVLKVWDEIGKVMRFENYWFLLLGVWFFFVWFLGIYGLLCFGFDK